MVQSGVNFRDCFAPYTYLFCLGLNFGAIKKLLKSWAESANSLVHGVNQFMKSTHGLDVGCFTNMLAL